MSMQIEDKTIGPAAPVSFNKKDTYKWLCIVVGLVLLLASRVTPAPAGMSPAALRTLAVMLTTFLWWVTETFPIAITALMIPLMVHTLGIMTLEQAIEVSFGNTLIPFMVGVLGLSAAVTASGLGRRIACHLLIIAGTGTKMVVGVYLWMSFLICMFMDPLAVVAMMLPLVLSLLKTLDCKPGRSNLGKCLMMAIMFGAILGGICTPAGVSSNVVTMAFLVKASVKVSFLYWTLLATPIAAVICAITWWVILKVFPPEIDTVPFLSDAHYQELKSMGEWTKNEKTTLIVFLSAIALWLTSDLTKIPIAFVSLLILAGVTLPGAGVFRTWKELHIEWGGVILLAGGFVVGVAASQSGLSSWVVQKGLAPMAALPKFLQPAAVVLLIAADSLGFSSFGTTASVNLPFVVSYAQHAGLPLLAMMMTAGIASSIHFILVTQSPSLVLPYTAGYFTFKDLAKIGICLTLVSAAVISIGMVLAGMPAGVPLVAP